MSVIGAWCDDSVAGFSWIGTHRGHGSPLGSGPGEEQSGAPPPTDVGLETMDSSLMPSYDVVARVCSTC